MELTNYSIEDLKYLLEAVLNDKYESWLCLNVESKVETFLPKSIPDGKIISTLFL